MYFDKAKNFYSTAVLVTILLGLSLIAAYFMAQAGIFVAPTIILIVFALGLMAAIIYDFRVGF
jgi:hypothetical protein